MTFRASFCDPFKKDIIQLGEIPRDGIIDQFETTAWVTYLENMTGRPESEIFYSPSLEIENMDTGHALCISAVGTRDDHEFYIFYKRPKKVRSLFGMREKMNNNYMTDAQGQTKQDVLDCLHALMNNDTEFLAGKIGE